MLKIAVFPGSFDPPTLGHLNIISRAAKLFDRVYVCAMVNAAKTPMFSPEERLAMLHAAVAEFDNVVAETHSGLLAEYAEKRGAHYLVKGVRNGTDFDLEYGLAQINKELDSELETVLLCAEPQYAHFSSTMARDMLRYHQPPERFLPQAAIPFLKGRN